MSVVLTDIQTANDETLVALARDNNEEAFAALVARCSGMLKTLSAACCHGILDTDDLTQEGLFGLLSAVQTYRPSETVTFRTYAYTCMRNRMVSALRRRNGVESESVLQEDEPSIVSSGYDPASVLVRQEEVRQLQERLKRDLTSLEYRVLMAHLSGYSYREIAEKMDLSDKSVDNALQRSRRKLTQSLRELW